METILVNSFGKVNRVTQGGRRYFVAPITMIVPGVLNGSKGPLHYPKHEIARNHKMWEGMPLTLGHPTQNGVNVSAKTPGIVDRLGMGEIRNVRINRDGKLQAQAWFDEDRTRRVSKSVYDSLLRNEPIEQSTGLFTQNLDAQPGSVCPYTGRGYTHVATNYQPDHVAVLPDQVGACSIKDGCGVLVNRAASSNQGWEVIQSTSAMVVNCGDTPCAPCAAKAKAEARKKRKKLVAPVENSLVVNEQPSEGLDMTPEKACKILKDGETNGRPLTERQRGMFGAKCGERETTDNWTVINCITTRKPGPCAKAAEADESAHRGPGGHWLQKNASNVAKEASNKATKATQDADKGQGTHLAAVKAHLRAAKEHGVAAGNFLKPRGFDLLGRTAIDAGVSYLQGGQKAGESHLRSRDAHREAAKEHAKLAKREKRPTANEEGWTVVNCGGPGGKPGPCKGASDLEEGIREYRRSRNRADDEEGDKNRERNLLQSLETMDPREVVQAAKQMGHWDMPWFGRKKAAKGRLKHNIEAVKRLYGYAYKSKQSTQNEEWTVFNCGGKGGKPGPCPEESSHEPSSKSRVKAVIIAGRDRLARLFENLPTSILLSGVAAFIPGPVGMVAAGTLGASAVAAGHKAWSNRNKPTTNSDLGRAAEECLKLMKDICQAAGVSVPDVSLEEMQQMLARKLGQSPTENCGGKGGKPGPCKGEKKFARKIGDKVYDEHGNPGKVSQLIYDENDVFSHYWLKTKDKHGAPGYPDQLRTRTEPDPVDEDEAPKKRPPIQVHEFEYKPKLYSREEKRKWFRRIGKRLGILNREGWEVINCGGKGGKPGPCPYGMSDDGGEPEGKKGNKFTRFLSGLGAAGVASVELGAKAVGKILKGIHDSFGDKGSLLTAAYGAAITGSVAGAAAAGGAAVAPIVLSGAALTLGTMTLRKGLKKLMVGVDSMETGRRDQPLEDPRDYARVGREFDRADELVKARRAKGQRADGSPVRNADDFDYEGLAEMIIRAQQVAAKAQGKTLPEQDVSEVAAKLEQLSKKHDLAANSAV